VFDRHTAALVRPPLDLAPTPDRQIYFHSHSLVDLRPGPAGQVVVDGPDGLELWNPDTGAQEGTIPLPSRGAADIAMDPTGAFAAVLGLDLSVQVLDLDRRAPASSPLLLPSFSVLDGFTEGGDLVVVSESGESGYELGMWDPRAQREVGSLRLPSVHDATNPTHDGRGLVVSGNDGALPLVLPLTPTQWSEQLCRITARPFTDAEREQLPAGTEVDAPCP
jgi:hypothetical protein